MLSKHCYLIQIECILWYCYSKVEKYDWAMALTGHVTLPYEVYIFLFDNDLTWSIFVVVECKAGLLVVAGLILSRVKNFFNLSLHSKALELG